LDDFSAYYRRLRNRFVDFASVDLQLVDDRDRPFRILDDEDLRQPGLHPALGDGAHISLSSEL
jgi:hypothetical protein